MPADAVRLLTDLTTRLTDRAFKEVARANDDALNQIDQMFACVTAAACKVVAEELIATLQERAPDVDRP
jgi:hypothetical protein